MEAADETAWFVACLGNPGAEYEGTRHNAGFLAADLIAAEIRANYWKQECGAIVASHEWRGKDVVVAKPQSFMNLSGSPVAQLLRKHGIPKEHLVVVRDDLDLPEGSVRIKFASGHGGQNGVRSVIDKLQTKSFYQVRIGIGRPPGRMPVADYVLTRPRGEAAELFAEGVRKGADCVMCFLEDGIVRAQDRFN